MSFRLGLLPSRNLQLHLRKRTYSRLSSSLNQQCLNCLQYHFQGQQSHKRTFVAAPNAQAVSTKHELLVTEIQKPISSDAQCRTIYALATPPGRGGVAVIRVSGPDARVVYSKFVRPVKRKKKNSSLEIEPRKMLRCMIVDPISGEELDDGMAVFFQAPHTFTTEDILELHIHSGRAVISAVLGALSRLAISGPGNETPLLIRPAERGEFTRRAFRGGRLDLTQAEALRDLIDADTDAQRRIALHGAKGSTRERFEQIRGEIIKAMAMTEALIDFGEGEDLEEGVYDQAKKVVQTLRHTIAGHLADARRGEILRSGLRLAIFGPPNAGKSSLLNFLAGREAAIVTPIPGTTRDVVELSVDIGGLAVIVADTAGLRKTDDIVERIGVERARERVAAADASLCVLSIPDVIRRDRITLPESIQTLLKPTTFVLLNKCDLSTEKEVSNAERALSDCGGIWTVSLTTREGLEVFIDEFGRMMNARYGLNGVEDEPLVTNERHRAQLERAQEFLGGFLGSEDVVVAAEELRYAANAIGKVTGAIDVEEVLDVVFQQFCIGK